MKEKILLIVSGMKIGGVEKSMSSLLNTIDTDKYDVDCFILTPKGAFMDFIPTSINIITNKRTEIAFSPFPDNIFKLVGKGYFKSAFLRFAAALIMVFDKGYGAWVLSRIPPKFKTKYDLAVDFNGQHQLYFLVDRINAGKKATFFHSDYEKWAYYYSMDKKYMSKVDAVFSISNECVRSLIKYFPNQKNNISLFENISSAKAIFNLSENPKSVSFNSNLINFVTVGRVSKDKGSDLAINAAKVLKESKLDFRWYFIGKVSDSNLEVLVKNNNLRKEIVFLGEKANPYPYIKDADIIVHPSRFEGKSIALDESKILAKPIVVTNFSTVNDQFTNRQNASICEMNPEDLALTILELVENENLKNSYIENLKKNFKDNSSEIEKLYALLKD